MCFDCQNKYTKVRFIGNSHSVHAISNTVLHISEQLKHPNFTGSSLTLFSISSTGVTPGALPKTPISTPPYEPLYPTQEKV